VHTAFWYNAESCLCPLAKAAYIPFADDEIAYEYGAAYRQSDHRPVLNAFMKYLVPRCRTTTVPPQKHKSARSVLKLNHKTAG
jgi:hypothetical protein